MSIGFKRPHLSDIVPPILMRTIGLRTRKFGVFGDYPTWSAALAQSSPYTTNFSVYQAIVDRIRRGEGGSGRNLFPIIAGVAMVGEKARVLDFGGNLGMVYFEIERLLQDRIEWWRIVDKPDVASYGRAHCSDERLQFFPSIDDAWCDASPNLILCSHALQYFEDPYTELGKLLVRQPKILLLHELPIGAHQRFLVQRLPPSLGGDCRPCQVLTRERLGVATSGYRLLCEMELPIWDAVADVHMVAQLYQRTTG